MKRKNYKFNFQLILTFLICAAFSSFTTAQNKVDVKSGNEFSYILLSSTESVKISAGSFQFNSKWVSPELLNKKGENKLWRYVSRTSSVKKLAGIDGKVTTDIFENGTLRVTRDFWISKDNMKIALRQKVTNLLNEPVKLKYIFPLKLDGPKSLVFKNEISADKWHVLVQQRLKNGQPAVIVPHDTTITDIDPFLVFHVGDSSTPDLLISFLNQTGNLAQFVLKFNKTKTGVELNSLTAECDFDRIVLPKGGERTSQWVYISNGFNTDNLIAEYADRVGDFYGIKKPPKSAPSVFCTWYFHGGHYNEKFFMDDIHALQKHRIPFDVFLIDACWAAGNWGYWTPNEKFPHGMKYVTDIMRKNGYTPGIWTAPFLVEKNSKLAKEHPEWLLRTIKDSLVEFGYGTMNWVLDPTYPGVIAHIEKVYRRLAHDYGFSYFKLDFTRAVFIYDNAKFYNPEVTRLQAYRMGLEAIRRGVGPDAFISVCGGNFMGSIGIANSQRSGSDVRSLWIPKQISTFRQNILRTWMSRFWYVDPDALMIRKRETPYQYPGENPDEDSQLSLGKLTNTEAQTFALNQYVGGGLVCFSEYLKELSEARRSLYRHVIPSINSSSIPLDLYNNFIPSMMLTKIVPLCKALKPWNTVAIMNLQDKSRSVSVKLSKKVIGNLNSSKFIVSEFFSQKILGIFSANDNINLGKVKPHESKLLRIAPWNGISPVLAGTDLNFSGGGVEIAKWKVNGDNSIEGKIKTEWDYPVRITVAFPSEDSKGYKLKTEVVRPLQKYFYISD